ncbi:MAG: type II secretion system protein [Pseudomonadota bacterium]
MTLIEVVVAIALGSLISLIVYQSVAIARRVHGAQQIRLAEREDARFVGAVMLVLEHAIRSNTSDRTAQNALTLVGTRSSVSLVSSYAPRASFQGLLHYRMGVLPEADGTLTLDVAPYRPPSTERRPPNAHRISRSICRFELIYFDQDGQELASWTRAGVLPLRISLTLQPANENGVCSKVVINRRARLVYARELEDI